VTRACALLLGAFALAGCAGGDGDDDEPLTVFAAASLTEVFRELSPDTRFNFAGSDELATQIREGARADVYAAASPRYPEELRDEGLVEEPTAFATNRLVLIVPTENPAGLDSVRDVACAPAGEPRVKLVIGAAGVPIGDYTREALASLWRPLSRCVVSEEEDVKGVVGKVALGEADAGFVYATDARAAGDAVRAIELPADLQADVRYLVAVVADSDRADEARAFVDLLLRDRGRRLLREAGFGVP
jgi:molybdate transport system substrate-binding protein